MMIAVFLSLVASPALATPMAGASPLCEALLTEPFDPRAALAAVAAAPDLDTVCTVYSSYRPATLPHHPSGVGALAWVVLGGWLGSSHTVTAPPLILALRAGSPAVVTAMLARGASPSVADSDGSTAVDIALGLLAGTDDLRRASTLATAGALLGHVPVQAENKLSYKQVAAIVAWPEAANLACPADHPEGWQLGKYGVVGPTLCDGVEARDPAWVARAIQCGASARQDCNDAPSVIAAAHNQDTATVDLLLADLAKPRLYHVEFGEEQGLAAALRAGDVPAAEFFTGRGATLDPGAAFRAAAVAKTGDAVRWLVANGHRVPPVAEGQQTPLHIAASSGTADTVSALLEAGDDPAALDIYDRTPLELAVKNRHLDTVRALLPAGRPRGKWAQEFLLQIWTIPGPPEADTPEVRERLAPVRVERAIAMALVDGGLRVSPAAVRHFRRRGDQEMVDHIQARRRGAP